MYTAHDILVTEMNWDKIFHAATICIMAFNFNITCVEGEIPLNLKIRERSQIRPVSCERGLILIPQNHLTLRSISVNRAHLSNP